MTLRLAYDSISSQGGYVNPNVSSDLRTFAVDNFPFGNADIGLPNGNFAMTKVFPVLPHHVRLNNTSPNYFEDFYLRLWAIPQTLDVGNLLSIQTRSVELWNAFLVPVEINALSNTGDTGITVTPPDAYTNLPFTLQPNQSIDYLVSVSPNGPPTINADVVWASSENSADLKITGSRIVIFPFLPDWTSGIQETIAGRSVLLRSQLGDEQSVNQSDRFRRGYTINYTLKNLDAQKFSNLMFGWQGRFFALPLWPEIGRTQVPIPAGSTRVNLTTLGRTFVANGLMMLFNGRDTSNYDSREILDVDANGFDVKTSFGATWPVGTRIVPVGVAQIASDQSVSQLTDTVLQAAITFACEPSKTDPLTPDVAEPATYRGYELYLGRTNWRDGLVSQWTSDVLPRDLNTAIFSLYVQSGYTGRGRSHDWFMKSLADVLLFREWLYRRRGKTFACWMPAAITDFTAVKPVPSASNVITVMTNGYATLVAEHAARRDIFIELYNGTIFTARINNSQDNGDNTTSLVVDKVFVNAFEPADIKRFTFLSFYRLSDDEQTITWSAPGKAESTTGLIPTKSVT